MLYTNLFAITGVAYAVYAAFEKALGDAIFGVILAILGGLSKSTQASKSISILFLDIYRYGHKFSRLLVFMIALGGTALSIDLAYSLDLLPATVDAWVKRAALPMVLSTISVYLACTIVVLFQYMDYERSKNLMTFLTGTTFFNVLFWLLFLGLPAEVIFSQLVNGGAANPVLDHWDFSGSFLVALTTAVAISFIWMIAGCLNYISEFIEFKSRSGD